MDRAESASRLSDEALMERVRARDADGFEALFDRHVGRALMAARSICRDGGRAEDAVQEVFVALWRQPRACRPGVGPLRPWLLAAVSNRAIDVLRREGVHTVRNAGPAALDCVADRSDPQADVLQREATERMYRLLRRLPRRQAEVVVLSTCAGLSHTDIADHLNLPLGTVKGRMRLALRGLACRPEVLDAAPAPAARSAD